MPDPAAYRCVACGARWTYAQVRNLARCPACGSGLQLLAPSPPVASSRKAAASSRRRTSSNVRVLPSIAVE